MYYRTEREREREEQLQFTIYNFQKQKHFTIKIPIKYLVYRNRMFHPAVSEVL